MNINQLEAIIELHRQNYAVYISSIIKMQRRAQEYECLARTELGKLLDAIDEREARLNRLVAFCNTGKLSD